jgi:hydroxymethylglutaryl-CoA lyase
MKRIRRGLPSQRPLGDSRRASAPRARDERRPARKGPGFLVELPDRVDVYEVGLRDGLQNEAVAVDTQGKVELGIALLDAGLSRIEATSFVSPHRIPQLSDAEELLARLPRRAGVALSGLVPNLRGLERACRSGIGEIAVLLSASEAFSQRNTNISIDGMLGVLEALVPVAKDKGLSVRGYLSVVWGCPYEGAVDPDRAVRLAEQLIELGCYEVSLGDTIGIATPSQVRAVLERLLDRIPAKRIALHLHDTRGTALTNIAVALDMGIRTFDSSIGGLGGCPYAPGASGNVATEDLVYMLHGLGVATGTDLTRLCEAACLAEALVQHRLPGRVHLSVPRESRPPVGSASVRA